MSEIGVASLGNCLEKWSAADEVHGRKCTICSQRGNDVKKLVLEAVPELLIIQLKDLEKLKTQLTKFVSE